MSNLERLVEEKNKIRAAMKKEYFKLVTNPNAMETGAIFDPALQRLHSMKVTRIDHFRETPKNIMSFCALVVIPLAATLYIFKKTRDEQEALYRSGQVAYKDRSFKFQ